MEKMKLIFEQYHDMEDKVVVVDLIRIILSKNKKKTYFLFNFVLII